MKIDSRYPPAFVASVLSHAAILCLSLIVARAIPEKSVAEPSAVPTHTPGIIWVAGAEPVRGGGGGGEPTRQPARRLERRGEDARSIPTARPRISPSTAPEEVPLRQYLDVPAVPMARGLEELPGSSIEPAAPTDSRGPGRGAGASGGDGDGMEGGRGPGLGPGDDGLLGSGVRVPGGSVSDPILVHSIRPRYTEQAMRARVQGIVEMDAVVLPDGRVGPVRIVRSLDRSFGLDANAIDAVKEWRFKPGLLAGKPVAVLVRVELTFSLR